MDIARSIQDVTERVVLRLARSARRELDVNHLCLAGGVALNCVANGKIVSEGIFDDVWIQPAAGDAGGALGAALSGWYEYLDKQRTPDAVDAMRGSYLGASFSQQQVTTFLDAVGAPYRQLSDQELFGAVADLLADEKVIGWFQGRMEFGPRALGARSILGDARSPKMQSTMNLKIKYRESFRPFAPIVKEDRVSDWFSLNKKSPYMLVVAPVAPAKRLAATMDSEKLFGIEKLKVPRSLIPAVTHVDGSARVQTVDPQRSPRLYALLDAFDKKTGCPVLINTSFNVRGEPIVCSPEDAYRCFMRSEIDYLIMENVVVSKADQPKRPEDDSWKKEFALD